MVEVCDPKNCLCKERVEQLDKDLEKYIERSRETHKDMYDRLRKLEAIDKARDEQYETITHKLDELIEWKHRELERPQKRWNDMVDKVIWAVLAAIIAFFLGRVGL